MQRARLLLLPFDIAVVLVVCAGYYIGGLVGLLARLPPSYISMMWPPNAILLAALLLIPYRLWWPVFAGVLVMHVHLTVNFGSDAPWAVMFVQYAANVGQTAAAAALIRRIIGGAPRFEDLVGTAVFIAIAAVIMPTASSGVVAYLFDRIGWSDNFWLGWRTRALSNVTATLIISPLFLSVAADGLKACRNLPWLRCLEFSVLAVAVLAATIPVFMTPFAGHHYPALLFAPVPFLLWSAVRFRMSGLCSMLLIVASAHWSNTMMGRGPFFTEFPIDSVLSLQLLLIMITLPLVLLTAVVQERHLAAKVLQDSQDRYRAVVEDQTELICRLRPDGTYTFANAACCRYFQRSPEALVGQTIWEFIPADRRDSTRQHLAVLTPEHPVATIDHRVVTDAGEMRWQQWTSRGFFDHDGRIVEYQIVARDVTELRRAAEERQQLESQRQLETVLRASEARFRSLVDNSPVLLWRSGLNNEGIYFNQPWLDFTGHTAEQALGFGWVESIHPDDLERCVETSNAAFSRREHLTMLCRLRRHDGEYRWVLDQGIPFFGADGIFEGYIGTCVDVTERKLAEDALEEAGRRKDEFLAMLGHELRNPLASIGPAALIIGAEARDNDSIVWAHGVITRQVAQLTRLVDDLLDLSRITRGTIRLRLAPVDFRQVIAEAVEASQPAIVARAHDLSVDVPEGPLPIRGDDLRLTQVICNLLSNAAKYTDAGGRITLQVRRLDSQVVLRIVDNGVGIPAEMIDRVFDMFAQADDSNDHSRGGLGIGLTVASRLVEMHGGTIEAHSEGSGRGSEFLVRLPLVLHQSVDVSAALPTTVRAERDDVSDYGPVRKRILIVDDNVDVANSLSRFLRFEDCEIAVAHDGAMALEAAERMDPDIVLLDVGLPKLDGLEVARRLRQRAGSRVVLVATTGFGREQDRRRTTAAGFDYHLTKPFDLDVPAVPCPGGQGSVGRVRLLPHARADGCETSWIDCEQSVARAADSVLFDSRKLRQAAIQRRGFVAVARFHQLRVVAAEARVDLPREHEPEVHQVRDSLLGEITHERARSDRLDDPGVGEPVEVHDAFAGLPSGGAGVPRRDAAPAGNHRDEPGRVRGDQAVRRIAAPVARHAGDGDADAQCGARDLPVAAKSGEARARHQRHRNENTRRIVVGHHVDAAGVREGVCGNCRHRSGRERTPFRSPPPLVGTRPDRDAKKCAHHDEGPDSHGNQRGEHGSDACARYDEIPTDCGQKLVHSRPVHFHRDAARHPDACDEPRVDQREGDSRARARTSGGDQRLRRGSCGRIVVPSRCGDRHGINRHEDGQIDPGEHRQERRERGQRR